MDDLEVRELRYFVAVAEELNFSRAAERLGIAQPPLSRAIQQIESRLGVTLLVRSTRQVALTDAGHTLLVQARQALDAVSAAVERTRRSGAVAASLVVTAKPGIAAGLLKRIVAAYRDADGTTPVSILVSGYRQQVDLLRTGRVDLAVLSSPYDAARIEYQELVSGPRVAVLPVGHALSERRQLHCRDLAGETFTRWPGETSAERAYWSGMDRDFSGTRLIEPQQLPAANGPLVNNIAELLEVVSLGQAVALVPQLLVDLHPRQAVVCRPVIDASPYSLSLAWPAGVGTPATARFLRVAMEVAAREQDQWAWSEFA